MSTSAHTPRSLLVTGGAGFIGSHLVRHLLAAHRDVRVVTLDALTYAGNPMNLADVQAAHGGRHRLVQGDICDGALVARLLAEHAVDTIVHLAAESHVDRSIDGPLAFVRTNVLGTATLLDAARRAWAGRADVRFHHVSTDEVYGSLGADGRFREDTPYDPSSPYSASKAGSDHLVRAWGRTYGLPVTITNCSNNYGPYQYPEKLIPLMVLNALSGRPLPVYGDGQQIRDWLYVQDHCEAIWLAATRGRPGETYNVGGDNQPTNLTIVKTLCHILDELVPLPTHESYEKLIRFVQDRPGHDRRYAMDIRKIAQELGWRPKETLETGLLKTVKWYLDHPEWVRSVHSQGDYTGWLEKNYANRSQSVP